MQDILFLTTRQAFLPNTQSCLFKQIQPNLRKSMASVNFVLIWFQITTVITRQYSKDTLILLKHFSGENDFQKTDIKSRSYCLTRFIWTHSMSSIITQWYDEGDRTKQLNVSIPNFLFRWTQHIYTCSVKSKGSIWTICHNENVLSGKFFSSP
jgi:hypothetical protein